MKEQISISDLQWYTVQTLPNQEAKVKNYIEKFAPIEDMKDYIAEVLIPEERVTEVKNGRKLSRTRKFYPGYIFIQLRLYGDDKKIIQKVWHFIKEVPNLIGFPGGDKPVPLKKVEMDHIFEKMQAAMGKETLKVEYSVGEEVRLKDGPFANFTGQVDEIDPEKGRLKVSVSIFGRFTPVELEYWQVERNKD